jgi:ribonuclease Z
MFEIIFLGTSASAPSVRRGLSAQVIKHDEYRFLIDCGEGTQRQILTAGIGFKKLNNILITHGHLDHILGLAGLLSTFMRWETIDNLQVFGPRSALERVDDLLTRVVLRGATPPMPVKLSPITPGTFFEGEDFTISAFKVYHRASESLGYLFEEKARRPFLPAKADALGIPQGPARRELVAGRAVRLADGRMIDPDAVLGPERRGTKFVHVGDCGETDSLVKVVDGADGLTIEATYLEEEREMARQYSHLTARMAAEIARKAGVKKLFLTHVSRRYREKDIQAEAQAIFPEAVVARDLDAFTVKRVEEEG